MATRRGDLAKQEATQRIIETFGANYAGQKDKKIYIWVDDGDTRVQLALSMTMPKEPVVFSETSDAVTATNNTVNFLTGSEPSPTTENLMGTSTLSKEDEEKINELMVSLGLE